MTDHIQAIRNYVALLHERFGLNITVHAQGAPFSAVVSTLGELNIHANPYCTCVKSIPEAWNECVSRQPKVTAHLRQNGMRCFFGSCYAGAGEYVYPIEDDGTLYGFISIGGYQGSAEKMRRFAARCMVDERTGERYFRKYLSPDVPAQSFVETLVAPLCAMLLLEVQKKPPAYYSKRETVVGEAMAYIHRNYFAKISLSDVAAHCHCSARTLSRLFAKETGESVGTFLLALRMKKARMLLTETALPVAEIAFLCGYSEASCFSGRFSAYYGKSPSAVREETAHRETGG